MGKTERKPRIVFQGRRRCTDTRRYRERRKPRGRKNGFSFRRRESMTGKHVARAAWRWLLSRRCRFRARTATAETDGRTDTGRRHTSSFTHSDGNGRSAGRGDATLTTVPAIASRGRLLRARTRAVDVDYPLSRAKVFQKRKTTAAAAPPLRVRSTLFRRCARSTSLRLTAGATI